MKHGNKTTFPGVFSTDDSSKWIVRARVTGVKTEKRRVVSGTLGDAIKVHETLIAEMQAAPLPLPTGPTVLTMGICAPLWLESLARRKRSIKGAFFSTRANLLQRLVLPYFGAMPVVDVRTKTIEKWKDWLLDQHQPETIGARRNPTAGQGYAHSTLLSAWGCFRQLMAFAAMEAEVHNAMLGQRFDVQGEKRSPKASLTLEEMQRLLRALDFESADISLMVIMGFATGSRFAEYSALEWGDIDFDRGVLRIERSQVLGEVGAPKTEATRRVVYLPGGVIDMLKAHREWQQTERRNAGTRVFPSTTGGYRVPQVLTKPLERCCARAGIDKKLTAHCLRRTNNNLLRQAVGEVVARSMVGHTTAAMTLLYSEVDAKERKKAHQLAFGEAFDEAKKLPEDVDG